MRTGAKIALLASFSHTAADYIFTKLAQHIGVPVVADIEFSLARKNGRLEVAAINGRQIESAADGARILHELVVKQEAFIPISFIFGTTTNHQGALFVDGNGAILLYEPYGTFKKKLDGKTLDYYAHMSELLSNNKVDMFSTRIQTDILKDCESKYAAFYKEFTNFVQQVEPATALKLQQKLKKIDLSSQSSKLTYVVDIIEFFQNRCDELPLFLPLYEKYSPYSCVMLTALEIWRYFEGGQQEAPANNDALWIAIENMCRQIAPELTAFIERTPECRLLQVRSWADLK